MFDLIFKNIAISSTPFKIKFHNDIVDAVFYFLNDSL